MAEEHVLGRRQLGHCRELLVDRRQRLGAAARGSPESARGRATSIVPSSGVNAPAIIFTSVDFPRRSHQPAHAPRPRLELEADVAQARARPETTSRRRGPDRAWLVASATDYSVLGLELGRVLRWSMKIEPGPAASAGAFVRFAKPGVSLPVESFLIRLRERVVGLLVGQAGTDVSVQLAGETLPTPSWSRRSSRCARPCRAVLPAALIACTSPRVMSSQDDDHDDFRMSPSSASDVFWFATCGVEVASWSTSTLTFGYSSPRRLRSPVLPAREQIGADEAAECERLARRFVQDLNASRHRVEEGLGLLATKPTVLRCRSDSRTSGCSPSRSACPSFCKQLRSRRSRNISATGVEQVAVEALGHGVLQVLQLGRR